MKRFLKISGIIVGVLAVALLVVYFYVVNNAETLIRDFVSRQSHGKITVEIKKIKFDPRNLRLSIIDPHFYSNDSLNQPTGYDIIANSLELKLSALKPLLFERKILLDTIICMRPQITITKWKNQPKENFSLPEQMGKAYERLNTVLNNLNIKYCVIDSGSFTLNNKVIKDAAPITITDYYLQIDNFKIDTSSNLDHRYLFTDRIKFYSSHQNIVLDNGNHGIQYSRLRINSLKQSIEIDSCFIYGKKGGNDYNAFGVFFDTLRLTNADFGKLTRQGLVKADSAICINPEVKINIQLQGKVKADKAKRVALSKDSMELAVKMLIGDLDVNYVGVLNASIFLQTKVNDQITAYSTKRNNFIIQDIEVVKDPTIPIKAGSFFVAMEQYQTHNYDSSYSISFDSILFRNNRVNLSNFNITPTLKNKDFNDRKIISMSSLEIQQLSWLDLIMNKKIVAGEVTMVRPSIRINAPEKKRAGNTVKRSIFSALHDISDQLKFDRLRIVDAEVDFYAGNKNHLKLEKVNSLIDVDELLQSANINEVEGSLDNISFASGTYTMGGGSSVILKNGSINGNDQTVFISAANMKSKGGKSSLMLRDIRVDQFSQDSSNQFQVGKISWQKAAIVMHPSKKKTTATAANRPLAKNEVQFAIGKLEGKNTSITMQSDSMSAAVNLDWIGTKQISWDGVNKPAIQDLQIKGSRLHLKNNKIDLAVQEFMIGDRQRSNLQQLTILLAGSKDNISVNIPRLTFTPDVKSLLAGDPEIKDIVIANPVVKMEATGNAEPVVAGRKKGILPKLTVNQITILNPVITDLPDLPGKKINIADQKSDWYFTGIRSQANQLSVDRIKSSIAGFTADTKKIALSVMDSGRLSFDMGGISFVPATNSTPAQWAGTLNTVTARNVELTAKKNDSVKTHISLQSLDAENLLIKSGEKITANKLLTNNGKFKISNVTVAMVTPKTNLRVNGLQYAQEQRLLMFDSMAFRPLLDLDSFNKANVWAKDYMQFKTGPTKIEGVDPDLFFTDTVFYAKKVETSNPVLQIYKDKRLPSQAGVYKPLPSAKLQLINKKIQVDSIQLNNADITYEEVSDKTQLHGLVHFTNTNGLVQGIKTFNYKETDSLRLFVTSTLLDAVSLKLRYHQSYQDSLHGFLIGVRLSPFDLAALNPILQPLVSVKVDRGSLDTLRMYAIGREYIAHGKMKMYYQNLHASYLNKGSEEAKTFKTRFITFLANGLIIHKKNKKGFGEVYAERIQEKSVFNYWLKMIVSGAISSTGVRTNKKQQRKYRKSVKRLKVPEIPETDL